MNPSIGMKVWTVLAHGVILIGMGHGIIILGAAEIMWLADIFKPIENAGGDGRVGDLLLRGVAVLCLLGQVAIIRSVFHKGPRAANLLHIVGICLLWASVLLYAYGIRHDDYAYLASISWLPFAVLSFWSLFGGRINKWIGRKDLPEAE